MNRGAIILRQAVSVNVKEGTIITTHESVLHKIDRFILYPLTQLPDYSRQWFIADVWYP
jgi:hypothetical protein